MATRSEPIPIPNLPGYIFCEKLGAGSYGKSFLFSPSRDCRCSSVGTVYKAKFVPVSSSFLMDLKEQSLI